MKRKILFVSVLLICGISVLEAFHTEKLPDDWRLILVNDEHSVPHDYNPELMQLSNGIRIDERIYPDLQKMFDDARND